MTEAYRKSGGISVQMFREILLLPLRLEHHADKEELTVAFNEMKGQGWAEVSSNLMSIGRSRIWPPSDHPSRKTGAHVENAGDFLRRWAYSETAYFHPFVQRFLYGDALGSEGGAPMRTMRRSGIDHMTVRMNYGSAGLFDEFSEATSFELELVVERIDCHHVREPGLVIVSMELAASQESRLRRFGSDEMPIEGKHELTLAEVLAVRDAARRVFPPFFYSLGRDDALRKAASWDMALFPRSVTLDGPAAPHDAEVRFSSDEAHATADRLLASEMLPVAPWFKTLFRPLNIEGNGQGPLLRQVGDDRMASLSFVAVRDMKEVSRADQTRLCFADHPGEGYPYDEGFLSDFEKDHCYDRFLGSGSRYMLSSYSFVLLTSTGTDTPEPGNFNFALDILQEHMRRHYFRIMLMVHIGKAGLLGFSSWMSQAMRDHGSLRSTEYRRKVADLRRAFLEFSQVTWFSNVSNQEQARELYAALMRHVGNAELYDEVAREQEGARGELAEIDAERQADAATGLNAIAVVATIMGLVLSYAQVRPGLEGGAPLPQAAFDKLVVTGLFLSGVASWLLTRLTSSGRAGLASRVLMSDLTRSLRRPSSILEAVSRPGHVVSLLAFIAAAIAAFLLL